MVYISAGNLRRLLDILQDDYGVYIPVKKGEQRFYRRYDGALDDFVIGEVRAFEPLKAFFTRAREKVAEGFGQDVPHAQDKPLAVVGVKACDLKGFKVQDHVFADHDFQDPLYIKNRRENLIISADCTCVLDTCFCCALGVTPFPTENYDINLSAVRGGYLVDAASEKGRALIAKHKSLFQEAKREQEGDRDRQRARVKAQVEENIKREGVPVQDRFGGIIERNLESKMWEEEAKACVECGACTIICPTCHCFLLYDQKDEERMARLRVWDSCMFKGYARVAGGANPRPKLWMRLRNRFDKKFNFFPKVADFYACTGCGRCISACPAKIDIRKVLKRLVNNV